MTCSSGPSALCDAKAPRQGIHPRVFLDVTKPCSGDLVTLSHADTWMTVRKPGDSKVLWGPQKQIK